MPGHMMVATNAYPELLLDGATSDGANNFPFRLIHVKKALISLLKMY